MDSPNDEPSPGRPDAVLYYDGECPICGRYRDYVAMRKHAELEIRDAREHPDEIRELRQRGHDIDEGMILVWDGEVHAGPAAALAIDSLTERGGALDRLARPLLRHPRLLRLVYPLLKAIRALSLKARGVDPDIPSH